MKIIEYTPKIVATNEDDIIPLLKFIYNNFSFGSIGVEFGSGHTSTYILGEKFMLTSFEESQDFMHLRYRTRLIYSTLIPLSLIIFPHLASSAFKNSWA